MNKNRLERLEKTYAMVDKRYGVGSVFKGNDTKLDLERIPSGSFGMDDIMGGGYPLGRIIEIYGPEAGGKTTLALHAVAEVQKMGGAAVFIDAEHALDAEYAKALGVNIDDLIISQPDNGEQALEIAEMWITGGAHMIVVDSVAALVPKAEIEGDMGDAQMGLHARLMSQAMRKLNGVVSSNDCILLFINQIREKINTFGFGSPETTTGGRALKFYASIRLDVRRIGSEKDGERIIGNQTKIKCAKNKTAPPFRQTEVIIAFGTGVDRLSELIKFGIKLDMIQKSGAWYNYGQERMGQGMVAAKEFLLKDNGVAKKISESIMRYDIPKSYQ